MCAISVLGRDTQLQAETVRIYPRVQTIESLPSGNYTLCSKQPDYIEDGEGIRLGHQGMCANFRKRGNQIKGFFWGAMPSEKVICISGLIRNNTLSGSAAQMVNVETGLLDPKIRQAPNSQMEEWDKEGFLMVGRWRSVVTQYSRTLNRHGGVIYYDRALLNLNGFYRYPAGIHLPPKSCADYIKDF